MIESRDLDKLKHLKREGSQEINVNPLQRGGILYPAAREAFQNWADGYSVCDFCDGRLDQIKRPPIYNFVHELLPQFLDIDAVRVTHGAREGKFMVLHSLCKPRDTIVVDKNAHYTTYIAAERNYLHIKEVLNKGYPEFTINPDDYALAIEAVKQETGKLPSLVLLTFPDGNYGNLPDAKRVAKISHAYGVPFLLNAAYAMGRMPLSAKDLDCDFIVGSGHKSMAASGPVGILGMKDEFTAQVLRRSTYLKAKEVEMLGCTARGINLITLMASFPYVVDRVAEWNQEVEKAQWFSHELEKLGLKQLGERPHRHDLMFMESPMFYRISQHHPRKRYFLYRLLKQRGISGIKAGLTRNFKLSTYRLSREELAQVVNAFYEIIEEHEQYLID